jgi:uncharacterized protein (DUF427 family)
MATTEAVRTYKAEPTPRWIRAVVNGKTIADTKYAYLLLGNGLPMYLFPPESVAAGTLSNASSTIDQPGLAIFSSHTISADGRSVSGGIKVQQAAPGFEEISGMVGFEWDAVDHWYEEEEEIFRHPRDPYHRVDAIKSSRHVVVTVNGQVVADTKEPVLVFETGLPTRYYIKPADVRMDLLESTDSTSGCPYKGIASYWKMKGDTGGRDVAWAYMDPIAEILKIKGLIAFFNERVDTIAVDGEKLERPVNRWS